jgi:hypothetical protein
MTLRVSREWQDGLEKEEQGIYIHSETNLKEIYMLATADLEGIYM